MRAMLEGRDGWTDDMIALVRFDIRSIGVPVGIWYSSDDVNSPPSHSAWLLANIPGTRAHRYSGRHDPDPGTTEQVLRWLRH